MKPNTTTKDYVIKFPFTKAESARNEEGSPPYTSVSVRDFLGQVSVQVLSPGWLETHQLKSLLASLTKLVEELETEEKSRPND